MASTRRAMRCPNIAEDDQAIDLTPMLDVVFILLIFFIVTSSFIRDSGIAARRPPDTIVDPNRESGTLLIDLDDQGRIGRIDYGDPGVRARFGPPGGTRRRDDRRRRLAGAERLDVIALATTATRKIARTR